MVDESETAATGGAPAGASNPTGEPPEKSSDPTDRPDGIAGLALAALAALPRAAVMVFDADLRYVIARGLALREQGLEPAVIEGSPVADVVGTERFARYEPMYRAALRGEVSSMEIRARQGDAIFLVEVGPLRDPAGAVLGGVSIASDITAQKRAEAEATRQAGELGVTNRELMRSNADLEQFASIASHDLREPLLAIARSISLAAERYQTQLDQQADEYLDFALNGCERLLTMIDGLLEYARIGRVRGEIAPIDANQVAAQAISSLGPIIDSTHAVVTVEALPRVLAGPDQLARVFQNLVSNALRFVAPGVAPRVTISAEPAGTAWCFTVTDNGIGIPPEQRENAFAMFTRLHGHNEYPGTGIGLAIVHKIVERHGGQIGIDDAPTGTGSRVWFTLPAPPADPQHR